MHLSNAECPSCGETFPFYKYKDKDTNVQCPYCNTLAIVYRKDKPIRDLEYQLSVLKLVLIVLILLVSNMSYRSFILYDREEYCCRHMARDLEKSIEQLGIPVTLKRGDKINDDSGHMWVNICGIDVDSVMLIPFPMDILYENITSFDNYESYEQQ